MLYHYLTAISDQDTNKYNREFKNRAQDQAQFQNLKVTWAPSFWTKVQTVQKIEIHYSKVTTVTSQQQ